MVFLKSVPLCFGYSIRLSPFPISAISGTGTGELLEVLCSGLKKIKVCDLFIFFGDWNTVFLLLVEDLKHAKEYLISRIYYFSSQFSLCLHVSTRIPRNLRKKRKSTFLQYRLLVGQMLVKVAF